MTKSLHVLGIGHALVDIIASCEETLLEEFSLVKGTMRLTSPEEATALYARMGPAVEASGGSAANTCAGIASLGGKAGFAGKVGKDQFADAFAHDIKATGVSFFGANDDSGTPTGRCLILVTPDGERTMNTNLGAAAEYSEANLDVDAIASAGIVYLEGYLFDPVPARQAFFAAGEVAHARGTKLAFTLSDPFCVDRHREGFRKFIRESVDVVFANEKELLALYPGASFDEACASIRTECALAAITRSEKGSLILEGETTIAVPAVKIDKLVDATGAGDLYAAGFLFGVSTGRDLETCAKIGSLCASEVIAQVGPRPQRPLAGLAQSHGLI
ncbi:adenosine kinase [Rhodomicrobium sp. Az07]|uniref:adenosine kinase n=1 Tax=Rhodomicrobium sp. Az07 TaxID=2839034 RepID=UPI001BE4FCD5|nr:adenosine kinase [Rhodomicrobium sp. Az07]MBT3069915.1 adenosine kinase [Rhodomicrobium sp. Az07]